MLAAGASGAAVVGFGSAAEAQAPKNTRARFARVVRHSGATADVEVLSATGAVVGVATAAVVGFPEGWSLRPGDRVVLTGDAIAENAGTVMPLVEPVQGAVQRDGRSSIRVAGRQIAVRGDDAVGQDAVGVESVAFCVRNDSDGSLAAVSVQPASNFAVTPGTSR